MPHSHNEVKCCHVSALNISHYGAVPHLRNGTMIILNIIITISAAICCINFYFYSIIMMLMCVQCIALFSSTCCHAIMQLALFVCMHGYAFHSVCLLAKYLMKYSTDFNETLRKWSLPVHPEVINFWSQCHS